MTDEKLEEIAEFYNAVQLTAGAKSFLRNCASFGLVSGTVTSHLPKGLQLLIRDLIFEYYDNLKEKQKEL
jgi:hypothetical protein